MSANFLLLATAAAGNLALGGIVLSRNPRGAVHRRFALFSLSIAAWTLSNALVFTYGHTTSGTVFGKFAFASAAAIPLTFLLFVQVFPSAQPLPLRWAVISLRILGVTFVLLSFSPLILRDNTFHNGVLRPIYGPLHLPFGIYLVSCFIYALCHVGKKFRALTSFQRLQIRYLFAGVFLGALGGTITNLLIPVLFGSSQFSRYGPLGGLVMLAMIAHSIIRHRLMNIRFVMRRGLVYLIAAAIAGAVFVVAIAALAPFISGLPLDTPLPFQVGVALLIALAFQPLKRWLQLGLDRYLYREPYDYQQTIRSATRAISSTLELNSLLAHLCDVTTRVLRPVFVAVYTRDTAAETFLLATARASELRGDFDIPRQLSTDHALAAFLLSSRQPLLKDEFGRTITGAAAESAARALDALGGEIAVPMLSEGALVGFLLLGQKLSNDVYFSQDVELLLTLANQSAIAVRNAQLYLQVVLANEYIQNILRTMDSAVITVDAAGRVQLCNSMAEHLIGLSRSVLSALTVKELPAALSSQLQATLSDGAPRPQVEATLPSHDLRLTPIVSSTSALTDASGHILGALIVFNDLSKLKALESEKRRAERLAAFGTLVSGIAHEIKNPLVAIKTFAELLPERFAEADFREDFAKVVITEIDRIDDLVGRLRGLAVSSPQSVSLTDIREPITETLLLLRARLEQSRTRVRKDLSGSSALVSVESSQLKQLFLNLFINSLEAMGTDGEISVAVHRQHKTDGEWIITEVSDTGPGIPESIRASIFDPFFTTKARGSGLGLAICRGITDAHRGMIRVENSRTGAGTTIVIELPATPRGAPVGELHFARR